MGTRKVGHAGTLDPMATGILLVGVNKATRLLGYFLGQDKSYAATIRLGQRTLTDDADGDLVDAKGVGNLGFDEVTARLQEFLGTIQQVPAAVSAIKVSGRRAYQLVRAGEEVALKPRQVTISAITVSGITRRSSDGVAVIDVDIELDCSSGTYVRALARDLGALLGCGGHLQALRRTRIGPYGLADVTLSQAALVAEQVPELISMAQVARAALPVVEVDDDTAIAVSYGRPLGQRLMTPVTAVLRGDQLLGLYRPDTEDRAVPMAILVEPPSRNPAANRN